MTTSYYISLNSLKDQRGLTLLEMLVVVFILSAVALMTLSFTNNADEQFRFEDTRTRLGKIRTAAVGEPERTINGGPAISGFVADIGRLPNDIRELIQPHPTDPNISCDGVGALPCWKSDPTVVELWAGWRGPYLSTFTEQSGLKAFRDGWGNAGGVPNYGWSVTVNQAAGTFSVVSLGSDGTSGGTNYAADYPSSGNLAIQDDHQINIKGWSITVTFRNPVGGAGTDLTLGANTLRLRLYYPQEGNFSYPATWPPPTPDTQPYLSLSGPATAVTVLENGSADISFSFGTTDKFVPWGVHALAVINDLDGTIYVPAPNKTKLVTLVPRTQLASMTMEWRLE